MIRSIARKSLLAALVTLLAGPVLAQDVRVRIQDYPGTVGTLGRVAIEKGYCQDHGLRCTLTTIPSAPLGVQTLMAGGLDVAAISTEVAVQSAVQGADLKLVVTAFSDNPFMLIFGQALMDHADEEYPDLMHNLKRRKVGVTARGAAPEFQFKTMLNDAGMKASDVTYVAVGAPNTAYPALLNKQIDAAISFIPIDGFCDVLKTCRVVLTPAKGEGPDELVALNGGGGLYAMRKQYLQENPEIEEKFVAAMQAASDFASNPDNLDELLSITEKYYQLGLPEGHDILRSSVARFQSAFGKVEVDKAAIEAAAQYMLKTGQLTKAVDVDVLF